MGLNVPEGFEDPLDDLLEIEAYFSDDDGNVGEDDFGGDAENEALVEKFKQVMVVYDLPKIPKAKFEKLNGLLTKVFTQFGEMLDVHMPFGEDETSYGFAFVVMAQAGDAAKAIAQANGLKLGKNVMKVIPYADLDKYTNWPEHFNSEDIKPFEAPPQFNSWLEDAAGRDQFVVRQDTDTLVHWSEGMQTGEEETLAYGGEREKEQGKAWCNGYTQWSPQGSYLATFHAQGIAIWGGDDFRRIRRYSHRGVQFIGFSPNEKFLITWNGQCKGANSNARDLVVWDTYTGKELRSFGVAPDSEWPVMKWSSDDQYFARGTKDGISVFETATMKLLQKKPVKARGVRHFEWSPSDNIIAWWAPEADNTPARMVLLDPITRKEVRAKNLFNVSEVKLHWQDAGDFLCVQVLRHTKSKKTTFTNLEVFRMRDADIPNEMVEIKERVEHFSWEPKREKFGLISGDNKMSLKISFYSMGAIRKGDKLEELYSLENKEVSALYWSPAGNTVVMAGVEANGKLEFWDVEERVSTANEEHFMVNDILWDPSGRVVATCVTQPMDGNVAMRYRLENGYNLWTFQGNSLRKVQTDSFYQFMWRPRPKSLLTEEEEKEISKNLKKYIQRYKESDSKRQNIRDAAANAEKVEALGEFRERMARLAQVFAEQKAQRITLGLREEEIADDYEEIEETYEEVIKETTEPYTT